MKDYIEERAVEIAYYIIEHKATVRQTAKEFGVSKSTIHKDCTDRLEQINPTLAQSVRKVLDVNNRNATSVADLPPGRNIFTSIGTQDKESNRTKSSYNFGHQRVDFMG